MNGISRVSPALEPVLDYQDETPDKIGQRLEVVEDEVLLAGAATLLALLQRVDLPEGGPDRITVNPDGLPRMEPSADSADVPKEPFGERTEPGVLPAEGSAKKGDSVDRQARAVAAGEEEAGWAKGVGGFDGQLREDAGIRPQELPVGGERVATGADEDISALRPQARESVPATEPRSPGDFLPGGLPARPELQVLAAQVLSAGEWTEQGSTPEQHDDTATDSPDPDHDDAGQPFPRVPFLRVPFSNDRARGEVVITREGAGPSGLLIRASERQVFEQLQVHFDKNRQPHWWLDEAPNDGDRRS